MQIVKIAAVSKIKPLEKALPKTPEVVNTKRKREVDLIALGASTGGTDAIMKILKELPDTLPGIVIVQHMPPTFTKMYAERLNTLCKDGSGRSKNRR